MSYTMRYILIPILLLSLAFLSCQETATPIHPTIEIFKQMNDHNRALEFGKIETHLDKRAKNFIAELAKTESIIAHDTLGKKYDISYFMLEYYKFNNADKTSVTTESLVHFLNTLEFSFFDLQNTFRPLPDRARENDNHYYLPLGYDEAGSTRARWLRFAKDEAGTYKYDLIYSIQQLNKKYKQKYSPNLYQSGSDKKLKVEDLYYMIPKTNRSRGEELENFKKHLTETTVQQ